MFVLDIPEVAGNVLSPLRLGPQKVVNPARSQESATEQTRGKYPPGDNCIISCTGHLKGKMSASSSQISSEVRACVNVRLLHSSKVKRIEDGGQSSVQVSGIEAQTVNRAAGGGCQLEHLSIKYCKYEVS